VRREREMDEIESMLRGIEKLVRQVREALREEDEEPEPPLRRGRSDHEEDYVTFDDVESGGTTRNGGFWFRLAGSDEKQSIPLSLIPSSCRLAHNGRRGDTGTLVVPRWKAVEKGWLRQSKSRRR
jgi:hypothetical protein